VRKTKAVLCVLVGLANACEGGGPKTPDPERTGGAAATGGTIVVPVTGGLASPGGVVATGGAKPATGGVVVTGGIHATGGVVATGGAAGTGGAPGACLGAGFLGNSKLLIGASMTDATAVAAPFDARYLYLAGGVPETGSCATCSTACGSWWGCWQDYAKAPGLYASDLIKKAGAATWQGSAHSQIPVFTYYEQLQSSKLAEGKTQVAALNDAAFVTRYLDDWRFLLKVIGQAKVLLYVEPDLWGYIRQVNVDPHVVPVKVKAGNATDCADEEDSAAGFSRCMIHMVRKYAPNAVVGLNASAWNIGAAGDGVACGNFMKALGAGEGDFLGSDPSDRDAGYYESQGVNRWWDEAGAQKFLDWNQAVAETVGRPMILWQIPLGNMSLDNTVNHYKDNRVDFLFSHLPALQAAHVVALLFGAGEGKQTTPETDGGNLVAKTTALFQAGGSSICK